MLVQPEFSISPTKHIWATSWQGREQRKPILASKLSYSLVTPVPGSTTPEVTENHDSACSQQQQTDNLCTWVQLRTESAEHLNPEKHCSGFFFVDDNLFFFHSSTKPFNKQSAKNHCFTILCSSIRLQEGQTALREHSPLSGWILRCQQRTRP